MGLATTGGSTSGGVGGNGLKAWAAGDAIDAAAFNLVHGDLQSPLTYNGLAGVLAGGVCTASGLDVTIPVGTSYFAFQVWTVVTTAVVVSVPDATVTWLWGCSDGQIRQVATMGAAPSGFAARSSCLITKCTAVAGVVTLDNTVQWRARYSDAVNRMVYDGPLTLDYLLNIVNLSAAKALQIPEVTADPTVPATGTFAWYRSDIPALRLSVDNVILSFHDGYDIGWSIEALPTASQIVLRFVAVRPCTLPIGLAGSSGKSGVASTAAKVFDVQVNGVSKGSINFAVAGTVPTYTFTTAVTLAAGDVVTVIAPATPDVTLAQIAVTLRGV